MFSHNKKKAILLSVIIFSCLCAIVIGLIPSIVDDQAKHRIYKDMVPGIERYINANICLVSVDEHEDGVGYGTGSSGVIIAQNKHTYYALTACHVVKNHDDIDDWLVITPEDPTLWEYRKSHEYKGLTDYYHQFPRIKIEYTNEDYDLAIVSFNSNKNLPVVSVATKSPLKSAHIAIVSNPEGQRFARTYGRITSSKLMPFKATEDALPETPVLKHNAFVAPGSSGAAVYNKDMQLAGINVGGGTDVFGRFRYGVMVTSEQVNTCIDEWRATQ